MLDAVRIFTKGGVVLFAWDLTGSGTLGGGAGAGAGDPIDALVRECLLEERGGADEFAHAAGGASLTIKWTTHNELALVFVAVHQRILRLTHVDDLLARTRDAFCAPDGPYLGGGDGGGGGGRPADVLGPGLGAAGYNDAFVGPFEAIMRESEAAAASRRAPKAAPKAFDAAKKAAKRNDASGKAATSASARDADGDSDGARSERERQPATSSTSAGKKDEDDPGSSGNLSGATGGDDGDGGGGGGKKNAKRPKEKRVWADTKGKAKDLDFSARGDGADGGDAPTEGPDVQRVDISAPSRVDADDDDDALSSEDDDEDDEEEARSLAAAMNASTALEEEDLAPVLETLKTNFMNKNVAEEIAERLCESVAASLRGRKLASFSSLSAMVKRAMEDALTRILTPTRSVDVLREVKTAKASGRPYVITFVGVNGVGKSTNLSKVAYWLLQHDVRVMIAACDTFRAGAVEQLRTHCKRLGVPLFERGYEKDPASVASEAVKAARRTGAEVVLVDTAGRMQDNEPLMRALAKLINVNEPDLVLFVGEALVGNDAVDQLSKFNERLSDLATDAKKRRVIDGVVLSKFDTIDDKVGAALSMVYTSGAPVMFVGCGQTYTDLKRLNVRSVVKSLLSK
ncbi:type II secretory pathway family protein [Micromonas pusilla CCMP1545]|uniref:Type II secretory pathway family protein n=1 Tax=Micromonas pusilla (strain CCMP1545) TaxID=564608 RepID=C1MW67_MICPC|nr:type II secretory pathway family protein [Micromonas pusilla CCMP1545]EEH56116.1 type II secretory pathway family protein [Micromonas pusilla CCMP1545]|eukprot:XP_003060164.1 type II secretory pathway family protein [Micromonas pusilla CCMP1545]